MSDLSKALSLAASGMSAQSGRMRHVSENIANADTPGYRRKLAAFNTTRQGEHAGEVAMGRVTLDNTELPQIHDPSHPMADEQGYYRGSNVDLMVEIADSREARRSYEANLKVFEQTRQMSRSLMDLLRR